MKKTILSILGVCILYSLSRAQPKITVLPVSVEETVAIDLSNFEKEIVLRSRIFNTGSEPITLTWEQDVIGQPFEWQADISDKYYYYFLYEDERLKGEDIPPIDLNEGEYFDLTLYIYPRGRAGEGSYYFNIMTAEGVVIQPISFRLKATDRKYEIRKSNRIKVFPNPTKGYFELGLNEQIEQISLYNLLGQKIRTYLYEDFKRYDVSTLPNGDYSIEFRDKKGEIMKTIRILVDNPRA